MAILVTGGSGFIGSALSTKLSDLGYEVYITGVTGEQSPKCTAWLDLNQEANWSNLKDNLDVIFHLAANNDTLYTDREDIFTSNVVNSISLFNKAFAMGCRKFCYASSAAVYGDSPAPYFENKTQISPLNVYAESKAALEDHAAHWASIHKTTMIGLRFCNIYGPGESHKGNRASMIYQMYKQMQTGLRPRIFTDGTQKRDWLHVEDACRCLIAASSYDGIDIFNCGSGRSISFNDLVVILNKHLGTNFEPDYIVNHKISAYQSYTECDMTKTMKKLNFSPEYELSEGIENMALTATS